MNWKASLNNHNWQNTFPSFHLRKELTSVNLNTNSARFSSPDSLVSPHPAAPRTPGKRKWALGPCSALLLRGAVGRGAPPPAAPSVRYSGSQSPGLRWRQLPTPQWRTRRFQKRRISPWPGVANGGEGSCCRKMPRLHKWTKNEENKSQSAPRAPRLHSPPPTVWPKGLCDWQRSLLCRHPDRPSGVTSSQTGPVNPVGSWWQPSKLPPLVI